MSGGSTIPTEPASRRESRLAFLDGLRGVALVFMVLNHTARWWMDGKMTWPRYHLIWITMTVAAPIFLFLVGFCLPLAVRGGETLGALLRKFGPRGAKIIVWGLLLNALVLPDEPVSAVGVWQILSQMVFHPIETLLPGGVLQTIGVAIVAMAPALWLLRYRAAPAALLSVAVLGYLVFVWRFAAVQSFVTDHRWISLVLFYDFPPWPWLGLPLIGLVLGWSWLRAHRRSVEAGARWLLWLSVAGVGLLAAFVVYDWWAHTPVRFGLSRDFLLNDHRTPRGASLFWVFGVVFVGLGVTYWLMEVKRLRLRWLVVLGQTALFLYFIHQVLVVTLVTQWLKQRVGWPFNNWWKFAIANTVLMLALIGLGWAWREIRPHLRPRFGQRPEIVPAEPSARMN